MTTSTRTMMQQSTSVDNAQHNVINGQQPTNDGIFNHDDYMQQSTICNVNVGRDDFRQQSTIDTVNVCRDESRQQSIVSDVHMRHSDYTKEHSEMYRLEFDSHANMPVVGKGAHVEYTGKSVEVNAFSPTYKPTSLPIVDAVLQYDCDHSGVSYLLIIKNALYVPEMLNHLIPPFIMRECGITVSDTPKIHLDDPGISDHSIEFPETKFRIPLSLHGIFSFVPTYKPNESMLKDCEEVYVLTPNRWDPHDSAYSHNEAQMLDWQGQMVQPKHRQTILLSDIEEDAEISSACYIGHVESQAVIDLIQKRNEDDVDDDTQQSTQIHK